MKIVKPSVELLGIMRPLGLVGIGPGGIGAEPGDRPEQLIELAGRTCYKSEGAMTPDSHLRFVDKVCNQLHHESVAEHSAATLKFVCDRGISHEIVRHRIASFSQESTRYCNYGKDKFGAEISVIEPPGLRYRGGLWNAAGLSWVSAMEAAEKAYLAMLDAGCTPQIARSVLPTCLKTEVVMTANIREWGHVFRLRLDKPAHPQIRTLMFEAWKLLKPNFPTLLDTPKYQALVQDLV